MVYRLGLVSRCKGYWSHFKSLDLLGIIDKSLHLVQFALDGLQLSRNLVDLSEDLYHPVFSRHVMTLWDLVGEVGKGRGGSVRGIQSRFFCQKYKERDKVKGRAKSEEASRE